MKDKLFANKEMLKWARESVHISVEQASKRLKIDIEELQSIENGEKPLSYSKLEEMAKMYDRPLALFFFSRIPEEPTPMKQFRTLPDIAFYDFDPNMYKLFRKAIIMQINVKELKEDISIFEKINVHIDESNMTKSCEVVRKLLDIDLDMQKKINDVNKSLEMWRSSFEKIGISVFKDSFQNDGYSGFCIYDKEFPVIYINNNLLELSKQLYLNIFSNTSVFEEIKLGDLCNIKYGKGLPTTQILDSGYPVYGGNGIIGYYNSKLYDESQVLISCRGAASGKVVLSKPNSFVTNNSLILEVDRLYHHYLKEYCLLNSFFAYTTGSAQPQITIDNIKDIIIKIPDATILEDFNNKCESIETKYFLNIEQNETLEQLRDILLPKLMNDEIDLDNIEI